MAWAGATFLAGRLELIPPSPPLVTGVHTASGDSRGVHRGGGSLSGEP